MSGTLLERLQQKVDAELEQYRSGLLSQGAQAVMDSAYELSVKSELAAGVECAFLDRRQLKGLLAQEHPLQYVYDRWEPDHAVIGDLLADTVYTAGRWNTRAAMGGRSCMGTRSASCVRLSPACSML